MDPSIASNNLVSSTRHWAQLFSGRPRPGFTPPAIVPNITRRVNRSLVVRCAAPAKRGAAPAKRRRRLRIVVSPLILCLLESLGVRHAVVGALSTLLKANDPPEEVVLCRSEFSDVLQAES